MPPALFVPAAGLWRPPSPTWRRCDMLRPPALPKRQCGHTVQPHRPLSMRPSCGAKSGGAGSGCVDAEGISELRRRVDELRCRVSRAVMDADMEGHEAAIRELESISQGDEFWGDREFARGCMRRLGVHEGVVRRVKGWGVKLDDAEACLELVGEEGGVEMVGEVGGLLEGLEGDLGRWEVERMLDGEYDECGCVVNVVAGAGGDDAADWAGMVVRMYERWAEREGFDCAMVEWGVAEVSGYKWATLEVGGRFAYGYLKGEKGTHRLVRIGPYNAQGKRQTSFVGVDVMPEVGGEEGEVEIGEVEVSTMRAGGKGGQNVNKVESAVRVVHVATGISVRCDKARSQSMNKSRAMKLLRGKLLAVKEEQRVKELREIRGDVVEAGWGMQIRNYVMHPYKMVKDLRTGVEATDVTRVLDGHLRPFMDALLQMRSREKQQQQAGV
eukprot:GFKZ01006130.1.p1 GENE.GFKZ01006130.1~~GFKZ01006130.1.p1  ORF type:complete len:441 (+),score=69.99 GFKZ01006130.1:224-1546(+)